MNCPHCNVEMVAGHIGKEPPLHLRFVPGNPKALVVDFAGVCANACPQCGFVQLSLDPAVLRDTIKN